MHPHVLNPWFVVDWTGVLCGLVLLVQQVRVRAARRRAARYAAWRQRRSCMSAAALPRRRA